MSSQRAQSSVEWTALVALVAVALVAGIAAVDVPWLPRTLKCALLVGCKGEESELGAAYGDEVAALVRRYAPGIAYEPEVLTLPIDFRSCRSHRCSDAPDRRGQDVWLAKRGGRRATVFTRVVDRRSRGEGLTIQYWFYFPDSTYSGTAQAVVTNGERLLGREIFARTPIGFLARRARGRHRHDWESYQVRVSGDGRVLARASAHNGYTGRKVGPDMNLNQLPSSLAGVPVEAVRQRVLSKEARAGWIPITGWTRVSRGSHAGHLVDGPGRDERRTEPDGLALVPIERLSGEDRARDFGSITPPWRKPVYSDPDRDDT